MRRRLRAVPALLLAVGCAEPPVPAAVTVTEEEGVRVVENVGSAEAVSGIRLREIYSVGLRDDEPTFEFITTGTLRPDGSAVIADANGAQVWVLGPDGEVLHQVGREGEGPGEYTSLDAALPGPGDTIWTQSSGGRFTTFHGEEVVEARRVDWGFRFGSYQWMQLAERRPSGDFLLVPGGGTSPGGTGEWRPWAVLRMSADLERLDTLLTFDGHFDVERGDRNPLRRWGGAWTTSDGFVVGRNDTPEVRWYDDAGSLRQVARWDHLDREMSDDGMNAFATAQLERGSRELTDQALNQMIEDQRSAVDGPLPIWRRLLAADDGTVWLSSYGEHPIDFGGEAFVIAADGTWLGAVETDDRMILMDVMDRYLLGVAFDPLDIQEVRLFEIVWPDR